jgi:hypothetical protein
MEQNYKVSAIFILFILSYRQIRR